MQQQQGASGGSGDEQEDETQLQSSGSSGQEGDQEEEQNTSGSGSEEGQDEQEVHLYFRTGSRGFTEKSGFDDRVGTNDDW